MIEGLPHPLTLPDGRSLDFERTRVMGVLNVTPDSFSDGGRFETVDAAVARAELLIEGGADLLDVGGESTRPGSLPVSPAEQRRRVVPVIERLARMGAIVSIDTTSAEVAAAALDAGASIVNDISAFRFDGDMLPLLSARRVPAVAMHTAAAPAVMQARPRYEDVVHEVIAHLAERLERCEEAGIDRRQIMVDPGIGFGKTVDHNLRLLRGIPRLVALGSPVLVGTSRKSFLGALTGRAVDERLEATAATCAAAVVLGAHVLRVHDVAELRDTLLIADAIAHGEPTPR